MDDLQFNQTASWVHATQKYIPTLLIPLESIGIINMASGLLFLACFTLTYPRRQTATFLRVSLFVPISFFCYRLVFDELNVPNSSVSSGMTLMGLVGAMRAVDICLVSLLDDEPPHLIQDGKQLLLPTNLLGRFSYAFDMLSSTRGRSWWDGLSFDWSTKFVSTFKSPSTNRASYIAQNLTFLVVQYMLLDALDTLNHPREWDPAVRNPVTSLKPAYFQIPFSFSVCAGTFLVIEGPNIIYSTLFVSLGGNTSSWPPMFNRPFHSSSLKDFWSTRWHYIFKRSFDRMALPFMHVLPKSTPPSIRRFLRALLIFTFSGGFHLVLVHQMISHSRTSYISSPAYADSHQYHNSSARSLPLLDPSVLKFFLAQPIGLLIDHMLIAPLNAPIIRRLFAWAFLLYSGRWWADAWVRTGMWSQGENVVGWSPLRGMLRGEWWLR